MKEYFIQIIVAGLGSLGYAVLFNIRRNKLVHVTIGGCLTWLVYLLVFNHNNNIFFCNMVAASFATLYSEILARVKKAPTTCFLIPAVMPLIPGGGLYYTMSAAISSDEIAFERFFINTVQAAFGISVGIMFLSVIGGRLMKIKFAPKKD